MVTYTLAQFDAILGAESASSSTKPPFTVPPVIEKGDRHETLYKFLRAQKAKGVSLGVALAGCRQLNLEQCVPPIDDEELTSYLTRVWEQEDSPKFKDLARFVRDQNNAIIKDHQGNIRHAMNLLEYKLSYNSFAERALMQNGQPPPMLLTDAAINHLWLRIDREYKFRPTFMFFEKVINDTVQEAKFHPVLQYLDSLKWDGVPRIDHWLETYGGAEDTAPDSYEGRTYLQAVSAIPLIAACRRARHPGCKYDEMLVIESPQGLNKSSALRALCPNDEWFSDDLPLNVDAKIIIERTLGKWIIEASDLVGGRKADRDHLKAMLSRQIDGPARMAYGHQPVERYRQFIIIGTTNSHVYLADMTGARRFWPVRIRCFDVAAILRDRDQLWAEAAYREAQGEGIRLDEALWTAASEQQEERRQDDAWEDVIAAHVGGIEPSSTGRLSVLTESLWGALNVPVERRDTVSARRIAEVMQRMGFTRATMRDGGAVKRGYVKEGEKRAAPDPPKADLPESPF